MRARSSSISASETSNLNGRIAVAPAGISGVTPMLVLLDSSRRPVMLVHVSHQSWALAHSPVSSQDAVNDLLEDRRLGMTNLQLVERYSISLSSVKRILKRARGT